MDNRNGLGKKLASVKIFWMNGEIFGAYKRSAAVAHYKKHSQKCTGTYQHAVYSDIEKAENNIIDPENKYLD